MWKFENNLKWKGGKRGECTADGKTPIEFAVPPEFGGPASYWSPEDLLVNAAASCLMASALFFIENSGVQIESYDCNATGTMEKTGAGLEITGLQIEVSIKLGDPSQEEKLRGAMATAKKSCPVSNALKCPVELTLKVA